MPLLDHFRPPLAPRRPREVFHAAWANALMAQLNAALPPRFYAAAPIHLGPHVEADVAEFDEGAALASGNGRGGGPAVAAWSPPAATAVLPVAFPDDIEVQVYDTRDGAVLVGVVELVSPRNKDRPDARTAFAAKCVASLARGVGVVVVDAVTSRAADPHRDIAGWLAPGVTAAELPLSATAYRPLRHDGGNRVEVWRYGLAVGEPLPTVPLALRGVGFVPLDLEAAYEDARVRSRV